MGKSRIIKAVVCGIKLLFIGTSVVPSIGGNLVLNKKMSTTICINCHKF